MTLRKDLYDLKTNGQLGDWCFSKNSDAIFLRYPISDEEWAKWCNFSREEAPEMDRGDIVHLPIVVGNNNPGHWGWDGNREAPTITPSINVIGRWHGYLRVGRLETV